MIFTEICYIFRNFFYFSLFGKCIDGMQMMSEIVANPTIVLHCLIYLFHMADLYFHLLFHRLILLLQQFRLLYILKNPSPQHKTAGKDHNDRRPLGKPSTINRFKLRIYTIPHITTGVEQRACQQRNPFCLLTVNRNYRSSYKIKCNDNLIPEYNKRKNYLQAQSKPGRKISV